MPLSGAVPAAIMPMHTDGGLDLDGYTRHIAELGDTDGVGAVVVNGHAAEITALSAPERRDGVRVARAATATMLVAGVFAQSAPEAVELAREAVALGADGLLVFPLPALVLGGSQQMGLAHVAAVADAVDVPLVVFSYPTSTGMSYTPDTLEHLCALPTVAAIKEWGLDIGRHEQTLRTARAADHLVALLTSFSTQLLPALSIGADGILSGHGSVVAPVHARLLAEVGAGDLDSARHTYDRLQVLTRPVYADPMANMYARMKEHLVLLDRLTDAAVRAPLTRVVDAERAHLAAALDASGLRDVLTPAYARA